MILEVAPEWLDVEAWEGYEAMRKKIKKPMTDRAAKLALKKLAELRDAGNDPNEVLDQSTFNSWQGLFEIKGKKPTSALDDWRRMKEKQRA